MSALIQCRQIAVHFECLPGHAGSGEPSRDVFVGWLALHARGQPLLPCDLARTLNMPALQPRALASADWRQSGRERKLAVRTGSYHLCDSRATSSLCAFLPARVGDTCRVRDFTGYTLPMTSTSTPPTFASIQEHVSLLGDIDCWWPYVTEIPARHGLTDSDLEPVAGYNGSYPTLSMAMSW